MEWLDLGSRTIESLEWQIIPGDIAGYETLRLTQSWTQYPSRNIGLIALYFPELDGIGSIRRFYPSTIPIIVQLDYPKIPGRTNVEAQVALRRVSPVRNDSNWNVQVEIAT
jgi:hypothetical protein